MSKSNYLEAAFLNHVFRTTALAQPANVYVSLHTADPGETGVSEVSGGSYARASIARADGQWTDPSSGGLGAMTNVNPVAFPTATANWGTVTHFAIWDAASAGNCLYVGSLATSRAILNGDTTPTFAAGALSVSES